MKAHRKTSENVVELIVVGNELLNGTTLDTNSNWLSRELFLCGAVVRRKLTVPDDLSEISEAFRSCIQRRPTWIISLGGLGPTFDDVTVQGLALALNRRMVRNHKALRMLRRSYRSRPEDLGSSSGKLPESSLKMAEMPFGSKALSNRVGSAPGVLCKSNSTQIAALPGVPEEVKSIFNEDLRSLIGHGLPRLKEMMESWLRVSGVGEPKLAPSLKRVLDEYSPDIYIKSHARGFLKGRSVLDIQLISSASGRNTDLMRRKLHEATLKMKQVALDLGGKVSSRS